MRERIEDVRKGIPPPQGRKTKKSYISKEDFADLLDVSRSRPFAWTKKENPEYPDEETREKLAELSGGRYAAADFARSGREEGSLGLRVAALERTVGRLERHIFGQGASRAR